MGCDRVDPLTKNTKTCAGVISQRDFILQESSEGHPMHPMEVGMILPRKIIIIEPTLWEPSYIYIIIDIIYILYLYYIL